jgi:hypothetical protein
LEIAADLTTKDSVLAGKSGIFSDDEILQFAKNQWVEKGIGDCFLATNFSAASARWSQTPWVQLCCPRR